MAVRASRVETPSALLDDDVVVDGIGHVGVEGLGRHRVVTHRLGGVVDRRDGERLRARLGERHLDLVADRPALLLGDLALNRQPVGTERGDRAADDPQVDHVARSSRW